METTVGSENITLNDFEISYNTKERSFAIPIGRLKPNGMQDMLILPLETAKQIAEFFNQIIEDETRKRTEMN